MKRKSLMRIVLGVVAILVLVGCDPTDGQEKSSAKEFSGFSFNASKNPALLTNVPGIISGANIAAEVPFGTDLTSLVASFTTTGVGVAVGSKAQISGITANNFTNPVTYTVLAEDASTKEYVVTITVAPGNTAKEITAFRFNEADNADLLDDVLGVISGNDVTATVPYGTNVAALVATFVTSGGEVTVGGLAQVSGFTANDFTSQVTYLVTAEDDSFQEYTVTVIIDADPSKAITYFSFTAATNGFATDADGIIIGNDIFVTVPYLTEVEAIIATFTTTGVLVSVGGVTQISGVTSGTFLYPVVYTVEGSDGTTQDYTVTVTEAKNPAKALTSFSFTAADNGFPTDANGTITGNDIFVTVPYLTEVEAIVATFITTGVLVSVGEIPQISGVTLGTFLLPAVYTVTADDGTTQDYTVTVTVAPAPKAINSFSFKAADNSVLATDVVAIIGPNNISATVPYGTNVTALVATFSIEGSGLTVNNVPQQSANTPNNFTSPVTYTVVGGDESKRNYIVSVAITPPKTTKTMTDFKFESDKNDVLIADVSGKINETYISAIVPYGRNVTALVGTFATTGVEVYVEGVLQESGVTVNDFTNPVTYIVIAEDDSEQEYEISANLVFVKGCDFFMGSSTGEPDEKPVRKVTLDSFYISPYEVTQKDYLAVMDASPSDPEKGIGDNFPVNQVSWDDAIAYCNALSEKEGLEKFYNFLMGSPTPIYTPSANGYRLPTEAEWELAARGGSSSNTYKYSGSNTLDDVAWYWLNSDYKSHAVGTKAPNDLGIYDMSGNVFEWCWDLYDAYGSLPETNPRGPSSPPTISKRVYRGGSWSVTGPDDFRVSFRKSDTLSNKWNSRGFRVVLNVVKP